MWNKQFKSTEAKLIVKYWLTSFMSVYTETQFAAFNRFYFLVIGIEKYITEGKYQKIILHSIVSCVIEN